MHTSHNSPRLRHPREQDLPPVRLYQTRRLRWYLPPSRYALQRTYFCSYYVFTIRENMLSYVSAFVHNVGTIQRGKIAARATPPRNRESTIAVRAERVQANHALAAGTGRQTDSERLKPLRYRSLMGLWSRILRINDITSLSN